MILEEMGHPQPPTPIQTDNTTACDFANDKLKQNLTCTIDMRFYWVRDRVKQGHFTIYWKPGSMDLVDYYTKHHPTSHHRRIQPYYVHPNNNIISKDVIKQHQ